MSKITTGEVQKVVLRFAVMGCGETCPNYKYTMDGGSCSAKGGPAYTGRTVNRAKGWLPKGCPLQNIEVKQTFGE